MNADQYRGDVSLLRRILGEARTIAVVGLSKTWHRPSNFSTRYMQEHGYRVIPVNPGVAGTEILGEMTVARLDEIEDPIDMVDIFRNSEAAGQITDDAIKAGAKIVWMQLGVRNDEAAKRAEDAGLRVVMNRCPKIEYARLYGELSWHGINSQVITSKRRKQA